MEAEIIEEDKSRLYWILSNIRSGFKKSLKRAFKNKPIVSILIVLVLLYVLFVSRGVFQPGVLFIRKYFLLISIICVLLYWFTKGWYKRSVKGKILSSVFLIVFTSLSWILGEGIYKYFSLYFHYTTIEKISLDEIPSTGFERIQPINSVKTLINQEALSETEDATTPRFVRGKDGRYYYSCALGPSREYKIQQMTKNMYELIHIPADLPSPVFSKKYRDIVNFDVGELLLFSKESSNAVIKRFNLLQYINYEPSEPIFLENEIGEWMQVVPLVRWKGILFPRPVFGGVMIIDELGENDYAINRILFGKGKYLDKTKISNTPELVGQSLLPKKVATFIAESFRFTNGFLSPLPMYHEGDIRIPVLSNNVDPQPFTTYFKINNTGKLYNFFGLEPYQDNKKGLSLSLLIPGDDDSKVYYVDHRKSSENYIGSSAISAKIIESKKNYDWSKNYPAESRPFVRIVEGKSRFFWLSTIVTKAGENKGEYIGGSIPEITLTDAQHGKVVWINQDSLINNESWILQARKEMKSYWEKE
ncbi:MAG: hypothetical protein KJP21_02040 [Bacteroidia bacterium]|nr:hypothetical protein [Bacteroidia bacterium]NNJ55926.1 hypothetical protein [Bacteroidia bacterium]